MRQKARKSKRKRQKTKKRINEQEKRIEWKKMAYEKVGEEGGENG